MNVPLVEVVGLEKQYPRPDGGWLLALDDVRFSIQEGECLGVVGESGSGKTTLARCMLRLIEPDAGTVRFAGDDLTSLGPGQMRRRRRQVQIVFQDPGTALDSRLDVRRLLAEPLEIHGIGSRADRGSRIEDLLRRVDLAPEMADRYPHELSGGQQQRVSIARALATKPRLLVLDEPVSALDVSVQARILDVLIRLQRQEGLTMMFISHDLAVVEDIADRVAVLFQGRLVEIGSRAQVLRQPAHPYTASLLDAVPSLARRRRRREANRPPASLAVPDRGCPFAPRCARAASECVRDVPPWREIDGHHGTACHHPLTERSADPASAENGR